MTSQRLTQASDFPYSPLDETCNEIRVLNLQAIERPPLVNLRNEPPEWHGLVHCTIEHVSLDAHLSGYQQWASKAQPLSRRNSDERWRLFSNERYRSLSPTRLSSPFERPRTHPRYHRFIWGDYGALSYTWGDQTVRVPIVINGQIVLIGQSLEAALRALSSDPDYIEGLKIWADAICINQKDLDERNLQVKRMRMIYGKALIVSIWLGAVPDAAVPDMAQLHELIAKSTDKEAASDVLEVALSDPEKKETIRRAIDVIVEKTYWTRIWVIQEQCLGPVNPSILFGTFRMGLIPLHNFLQATTNIHGAVRAREKVWRVLKLVELVTSNQERVRRRHTPTDQERRKDQDELGLLLMIGRMARSLDLRDRLYGLMGMIPEYVAKHIEPDYEKTVEDVFCDFAKALITGFGSFDIVLTGTTESTLTLPSWVPDLTSQWDPYLWGSDCDASWGQEAKFSFEQDGKILVASGYLVDAVDGIAPFLGWEHGELRIWQDAVHPASKAMADDPKSAILRTLHRAAIYECSTGCTVLDIPWLEDLKPDNPDVVALKKRGWGKILKHANLGDLIHFRNQINAQFRPWGREFKSFFPRVEDIMECKDPKPFLDSLDKHVGIVYPLFTTVGGLFGTAILQALRKGDSIFVIPGCSAPIIMRHKGDQWQVITQCFIDGLMRGETRRQVEQGTYKLSKLLIV
ncbi:heterokaryon incompatibility protein [Colletotrichum sublineola]|uniref:Putative heterokaryon incompatibility protein n=1 Tax=Colletotrichum sublineola TaxID=1173701 RepID=A0A066XDI3_COLSU|nr:heterokaryon incompatibility protein [Colletotrichum sublineola]KDN67218.1 putative heterokaryon incompatibility protein [Colletotrichum sublineola]